MIKYDLIMKSGSSVSWESMFCFLGSVFLPTLIMTGTDSVSSTTSFVIFYPLCLKKITVFFKSDIVYNEAYTASFSGSIQSRHNEIPNIGVV